MIKGGKGLSKVLGRRLFNSTNSTHENLYSYLVATRILFHLSPLELHFLLNLKSNRLFNVASIIRLL